MRGSIHTRWWMRLQVGRLLRDFLTFLFHSPMPIQAKRLIVPRGGVGVGRATTGKDARGRGTSFNRKFSSQPRDAAPSLFFSFRIDLALRIFRNSIDTVANTAAFFEDTYIYIKPPLIRLIAILFVSYYSYAILAYIVYSKHV